MIDHTHGHPDDEALRSELQEALADRFDGVDWSALHEGIVAAAMNDAQAVSRPADVLAGWSGRGAVAAGALLAAGLAAVLFTSHPAGAGGTPPGFWPVAEELLAEVPEDTRWLIEAGADVESLLRSMAANRQEKGVSR